jgi:hypothetical protein
MNLRIRVLRIANLQNFGNLLTLVEGCLYTQSSSLVWMEVSQVLLASAIQSDFKLLAHLSLCLSARLKKTNLRTSPVAEVD